MEIATTVGLLLEAPSTSLSDAQIVFLFMSSIVVLVNTLMLLTLALHPALVHAVSPYVVSLAVTDLLVGISMWLNHFFHETALLTSSVIISSHFHLLVIALDRCASVVAPLVYQARMTTHLSAAAITLVCVISILISGLPAIFNRNPYLGVPTMLQLVVFAINAVLLVGLYSYLGAAALQQVRKINQVVPV
jgi:hypothetical protein